MRVILAQPRGFCASVVRATDTVEHAHALSRPRTGASPPSNKEPRP